MFKLITVEVTKCESVRLFSHIYSISRQPWTIETEAIFGYIHSFNLYLTRKISHWYSRICNNTQKIAYIKNKRQNKLKKTLQQKRGIFRKMTSVCSYYHTRESFTEKWIEEHGGLEIQWTCNTILLKPKANFFLAHLQHEKVSEWLDIFKYIFFSCVVGGGLSI